MSRVLIIGQQCYDIREGKQLLGGPAQYQIPIFLTFDWEIDVYTRIDNEYSFPSDDKVRIINEPVEKTTTFNYSKPTHYNDEDRILTLTERAPGFETIDATRVSDRYDAVIISGIAGELSQDQIIEIHDNISANEYYLDLQTISRSINEEGKIELSPPDFSDLDIIMDSVDLIKGSTSELGEEFEISGMWNKLYLKHQDTELVETTGSNLIRLYHDQISSFRLDGVRSGSIVDATGSGDIFLASLVHYIDHGLKTSDAIIYAHHIARAHLIVEGVPTPRQSNEIIENVFKE